MTQRSCSYDGAHYDRVAGPGLAAAFAGYGITSPAITDMRRPFAEWRQQLLNKA